MNTIPLKRVSVLLGFAAATTLFGSTSAQAETTGLDIALDTPVSDTPAVMAESEQEATVEPAVLAQDDLNSDAASPELSSQAAPAIQESAAAVPQADDEVAASAVSTSAEALSLQTAPTVALEPAELDSLPAADEVAQTDLFGPRPSGVNGSPLSYIGVGGNIGIVDEGDSAVGEFGFSIISKIALSEVFSVRPGLIVSEGEATFVGPLTYDFGSLTIGRFQPAPYVGIGPSVGNDLTLLVTGGVDYPISRQFVGNAALNISFLDEFDMGLTLGFGYKFQGPF